MRTQLALVAMAMLSTSASAEPAPADPYADQATTAVPGPPRSDPKSTTNARADPLGIVALDISPELRMHLGAPRDRGVLVDVVVPGTFAARAGLKVGDLVLDIDNIPVTSAGVLVVAAGKHEQGDQVVLDLMRTGVPTTLRAKLDLDPSKFDLHTLDPQPASALERQLRQQVEDLRRRLDAVERRFEDREKRQE